jgi:dTDP-4-dehydrorhamnose reductase
LRGVLIVGVDSLVGAATAQAFRDRGRPVYGTTRRRETVSDERLFLDLSDPAAFRVPPDIDAAVICAAVTPYGQCETDPAAFDVNVQGPARLAGKLANAGVFVVYLSSNTVFGGNRPYCNEDDPVTPGFPYAEQKAQAEYALSEALSDQSDAWCIVRLTKVLAPHTPPLPHWSRDLSAGRPIHPFADLIFAPISCQFAARSLVRVAEARLPGRFHLSGKENLSYADFAIQTVAAMGLPAELVQPTTAVAAGVRIAFQPRFSALGMARTQARLDISPQPADSVVADLLA